MPAQNMVEGMQPATRRNQTKQNKKDHSVQRKRYLSTLLKLNFFWRELSIRLRRSRRMIQKAIK
jgi:hypothetical protein